MISNQEALLRNKITGVLLRQARMYAGVDIDACAAALSRDPAFIERAEEGREALTLPQLESLALVLDVPIGFLLGEQELPADRAASDPAYYDRLMTVRRKIIGVILQQARTTREQTLDDLADILGWEPERLRQVEWGEEPVSLVELQALAGALGLPMGAFVDRGEPSPPQGEWREVPPSEALPSEAPPRETSDLAHLPVDVQEFITQPINVPYLQVAMNLSHMPAEALRQLASGLFEITY